MKFKIFGLSELAELAELAELDTVSLGGSQNPRRIGDKKMIFHVTARYLRLLLPGPAQRLLGPANMSRHLVSFLYELW